MPPVIFSSLPRSEKSEIAKVDDRVKASRFNIAVPLLNAKLLVYNTLYQRLLCLKGPEINHYGILEQGAGRLAGSTMKIFVDNGIAVPTGRDELIEAQKLYGRTRFNKTHLQLTIAPTLGCNFVCDYCFQGRDKPLKKMSPNTRRKVLAFVSDNHRDLSSLEVCWYGGEPLNDKKSIFALSTMLLTYCRRNSIDYIASIVTNGYQLSGRVARELEAAGLRRAQITLDGPRAIHDKRRVLLSGKGSYDRIIANLHDILGKTDLKITLRCNVDMRNIEHAYSLIDELYAEGFGHSNISLYVAPVQTMTRECISTPAYVVQKSRFASKELALLRYAAERGLYRFTLPTVFTSICVGVRQNGWLIGPNGDLHKCFDTVQRSDMKVGNIHEDIVRLNDNPDLVMWRSWTPFTAPTCRCCSLLPSCAGSCAYKYIHCDRTKGEASRLPCPSIKLSIAERLFEIAIDRGMVGREDWDPMRSPTTSRMVGPSYTDDRLAEAVGIFHRELSDYERRIMRTIEAAEVGRLDAATLEKIGYDRDGYLTLARQRRDATRRAVDELMSRLELER